MGNFKAYFSTGEGIEDVLHIDLAGDYLATLMAFNNHCDISIHEMGKDECLALILALSGRLTQLAEKENQ